MSDSGTPAAPRVTVTWAVTLFVPLVLAFGCVMLAIATAAAWPMFAAVVIGPIATAASLARLAIASDLNAVAPARARGDARGASPVRLATDTPQREAA